MAVMPHDKLVSAAVVVISNVLHHLALSGLDKCPVLHCPSCPPCPECPPPPPVDNRSLHLVWSIVLVVAVLASFSLGGVLFTVQGDRDSAIGETSEARESRASSSGVSTGGKGRGRGVTRTL